MDGNYALKLLMMSARVNISSHRYFALVCHPLLVNFSPIAVVKFTKTSTLPKPAMKKFLAATLAIGAMLLAAPSVIAQYQVTTLGVAVVENFDGMLIPTGAGTNNINFGSGLGGTSQAERNAAWALQSSGSAGNVTGTSTTGGWRAYSDPATEPDKALGGLGNGSLSGLNATATYANATGSTVTSFVLTYTGEHWRRNTRDTQFITVQYSISGGDFTALAGSTWNVTNFGTSGALDGDAAGNRVAGLGNTVSDIILADGQNIQFRFFLSLGSNSNGIAIDDVSVTFIGAAEGTGEYWSASEDGGGSGTWTSEGTNWATGPGGEGRGVTQGLGTLNFTDAAGTVTVDGGVTVNSGMRFSTTGYTIESSTISLAGGTSAANTVTTETGVTATINSQLTGSSGMTKAGAGELVLGGANTYTGITEVSAGTLALAESGSLASSVALASGTTFDLTAKPTGYALASGTTLSGTGTVTTAADQTLSIGSGATIQPATATTSGILTLDGLTFAGGGTYDFSIGNVSGTAGTAWDLISVNNNFDITASSGNEFVISIAGNSGVPTGFSNLSNYSWEILSLGSGEIVGFDPESFGFVNNLPRSNGTFSVTSDGSSLTLNYAAGTALSVAYQGGNGGAWTGAGNWAGGFIPNTDEIAQFGATPTQANATVGLNMNTAGGAINVGAIEVTAAREQNLTLSNSTTVASGTLTMVGVEVNGTENVVLRNASDSLLTLTNGTSRAMDVAFANATENKIVIDGAGGITIASDIISADAGVTKAGVGEGILTLAGVNTYTGATVIESGTLALAETGSIATSSAVVVGAGATFDVSALAASFNVGGSQAIGGAGTIDGNLSLAAGAGLIVFDLNTPLTVTGTVTLDDTFSIASLLSIDGTAFDWSSVADGTYTLIANGSSFDNIQNFGEFNQTSIGGGRFAYFSEASLEVNVVPEPSTYALLALSGLALAGYAARRRQRQK